MFTRLGIDASQSLASCAISDDSKIIASATIEEPIENFPALIRDVVDCANTTLCDIDEIVVCIGPGSQTGIRTAVVTGNALALALNKPISGVLSTDAAAVMIKAKNTHNIAVSAGRRRYYVESYNWNNNKLFRLEGLRLIDEFPENAFFAFHSSLNDLNKFESCACGILMVAEHQRHLIEQSLLNEVMPYESGKVH